MFQGLVFHIIPVGIGKVQQQILREKITSKGGMIVDDVEDFLELDDLTRLALSTLDYQKIALYLDEEQRMKGIRLHTPEWVSTSLLKGGPVPEYAFRIEKKIDPFAELPLSTSSEKLANEASVSKKRDRDTFEPSFQLGSPKRARVDYKPAVKLENTPTLSLQLIDGEDEDPKIKKEPQIKIKKEEGFESDSDSDDAVVLRSSTGAIIDFNSHLANFEVKPEKVEEGVEEFEKEGEPWYSGLLNPFSPKKNRQPFIVGVKEENEGPKSSKEGITEEMVKINKESFSSLFSSSSDSMNASENNTTGISQYVMSMPEDVKRRNERFRARFSVSKSSIDKRENLNKHITDKLEVLEKNCDSNNDKWRSVAYNKAIRALKNASFSVTTPDEVLKVPNIGKRIYDKIVEILETGTLRRADLEQNDERNKVYALFTDVWGAGPATVSRWYSLGFRTLDDVLTKAPKITPQQRIGIKYYDEFKMRIPRDEVTTIGDIVASVAHQIDPQLKLVLGGSFRRGRETCGDIDILVTHKKTSCLPGILARMVKALHLLELLTDDLVSVDDDSDFYMGVCMLKNTKKPHRRIDIRLFPKENWGAALLYFTGSKNFNRSMRLWAQKVGFHLGNELVRMIGGEQGEVIACKTEEEVFKVLGLEYRRPEEREI